MLNNKQRPRYSLADLLAECKPDEPMSADMIAWEQMPEVGKERWPELAEATPERNGQGKKGT